ncbi:hypothetical protein MOSL_2098 [Moraxella osloensis]|nr:hypothetical protein MOSL_2098 [Moraxella osloensis]
MISSQATCFRFFGLFKSAKSIPVEKLLPSPAKITARTSVQVVSRWAKSMSLSINAKLNALRLSIRANQTMTLSSSPLSSNRTSGARLSFAALIRCAKDEAVAR